MCPTYPVLPSVSVIYARTMSRLLLLTLLASCLCSAPSFAVPAPEPSPPSLELLDSLQPLLTIPTPSTAELAAAAVGSPSESQPNPIANEYPNNLTGTFNTSFYVVPIPYAQARAIVPVQYPILMNQVEAVWTDYQPGTYPVRSQVPLVESGNICLLRVDRAS